MLTVAFVLVSLVAAAVRAEPILIKEKKRVSIDTDTGQTKAAKGMIINRETGNREISTKNFKKDYCEEKSRGK
jgi:hypothetical protein